MRRLSWLAALIFIGCGTGETPPEIYTLAFEPPDSTHFVVRLAMQRATTQGDQSNLDSTWTRTGHALVAAEGGYALTGITDSIVMYHNGAQIHDPLVQLFARSDITYRIDTAGRAMEVLGYDEVFAALDTLVGPDTAAAVRQMVNPQSLQAQEIETWNRKFAAYVGRGFKLGEVELDSTFIDLPIEGRVALYTLTEIVDTVRPTQNLCVRLRVASATDPVELARLAKREVDEIVGLFGLSEELVARAAQRQAGSWSLREWVLEVETMLTHSEFSNQEIFYSELSPSGLPVRNQMTETQTKSYSYPN